MESFGRILHENLHEMEQVKATVTIVVLSGNLRDPISAHAGRANKSLFLQGQSLFLGNSGSQSLSCPLLRAGDNTPSSSSRRDVFR